LLFAILVTPAQYGFDVWTTANGLPQNTVNGITQTPNGYLWLATFDGLARFDGVRFTIFDKGNSKGIVSNRFVAVFAAKDGAVWAATENGVLTVYRGGVFESYSTPEGLREYISNFAEDPQSKVRIETSENYYYLKDGKFALAPDQKKKGERTVYFGKSGAKWILTTTEVLRHKDGIVTRYPVRLNTHSLEQTHFGVPYEDSRGGLWLVVNYDVPVGQLYRLHNGETKHFTDRELPELRHSTLHSVAEQQDGSIWIIFADTGQEVVPLTFALLKDGRVSRWQFKESVLITKTLIDREGNFWLATYKGLRRFRRQIVTTLSEKDGLSSNEVYPLLQTMGGDVFIGTINGVNRFDADGKINELKLKSPNTNTGFLIRGLWEDERGRVWLGSYQGSGRLENDSLKVVSREDSTDFISDRAGNVWMATNKGLVKFKDDKEIARYTIENGLPHNEVITVHEDRNGNIWAGTFDGLALLGKGEKGAYRFENFNNVENSPKGFVRYIYEDADGVLWFGTYSDGLVRYKDGKFFNYRVEHGLFNNGVFAVLEDNHGNFWMSSNRGIHRINRQELNDFADGKIPNLSSISYDESDGMLNVECNGGRMPSAIKTKDGKFWFATMGGVAIIDPEAEAINPNPPPVLIENISIDRKPVETQVLQSAIGNRQSAIEMSPGQSNLEINYTSPSLVKSSQIKFKYKLEGFEENWVEVGRARAALFSYLPYGEYTFHVIAANANGVWNTEGARVKIIVHPYFYQTWWFLALVVLSAGGIVFLIYRNRVSHLREIAETKTNFSRQLIESQETERKRIASELHDGLGQSLAIISNRAAMGKSKRYEPETVSKEFDEISNNALDALDEVQEITNKLHPHYLERLGLSKALKSMFIKVQDVVEFTSEVDSIDNLFPKEAEINVYRIVQESVNNIIKHSDASEAEVKVKKGEYEVLITIKDDGRGFDTNNIKSNGTGLGLVGLKERTNMIGGRISINSSVGNGTEIKVILPIKNGLKS